jgi:hypothetical protein
MRPVSKVLFVGFVAVVVLALVAQAAPYSTT